MIKLLPTRYLFAFVVCIATLSVSAQTEEQPASQVADFSHVAGTFHFESPTNNMMFWRQSFIESLYGEIEHLRQPNEHYRWHFSTDMIIVIYSKEYVESSEFIPNNSPYNKVEKL